MTYLKGEAAKGATRLTAYNDGTGEQHTLQRGTIRRHSTLSNRFVESLDLPSRDLDLTKPIINLEQKFVTTVPSRDRAARRRQTPPPPNAAAADKFGTPPPPEKMNRRESA